MDEWRPWTTFGEMNRRILGTPPLCIVDETGCDALPLVHTLLGQTIKASSTGRVMLITLQRPAREFVRTSRRLGHDLSLASVQGRFMALDAVGGIGGPKFHSLDMLAPQAEETMLEKMSAFGSAVTVFVDGLDAVCSVAGWPVARAMRLVRDLERLAGAVVCRLTAGPSVECLVKWLVHRSKVTIICRGLSSLGGGSTVHAHGQMIVYSSDNKDGIDSQSPSAFLFKCTDVALLLQSKFIDPLCTTLEEAIKA